MKRTRAQKEAEKLDAAEAAAALERATAWALSPAGIPYGNKPSEAVHRG